MFYLPNSVVYLFAFFTLYGMFNVALVGFAAFGLLDDDVSDLAFAPVMIGRNINEAITDKKESSE
ncbi:MAG: hypothetical protein F6K42_15445 [Leptolyngbya sp. SIO1D8]|nr:hypothetical protein [Leptolyngbya sp. SIO1D8]